MCFSRILCQHFVTPEKKRTTTLKAKEKKNETSNQAPRMSIFNNFNRKLRNCFFWQTTKTSEIQMRHQSVNNLTRFNIDEPLFFLCVRRLTKSLFLFSFSFWFLIFFPSIISRYYWTIPYSMNSGFVSFHLFAYVYCLLLCIDWMWSDGYCG